MVQWREYYESITTYGYVPQEDGSIKDIRTTLSKGRW